MTPRTLLIALSGAILLGLSFIIADSSRSFPSNDLDNKNSLSSSTSYTQFSTLHLEGKDKAISLIVSDTPITREKGLSEMASLPNDSAMFFVFERLDKYGFWMKDMNFPIDIIWLDDKYIITHIESNISPDTFPKVFYPEKDSLYALETNAYFAQENALKVGDKLDLK